MLHQGSRALTCALVTLPFHRSWFKPTDAVLIVCVMQLNTSSVGLRAPWQGARGAACPDLFSTALSVATASPGGGVVWLLSLRELVQRSSLIFAVFFSSVVALGTCSPAGSICSTVELKGDGLGCTDDKLQCKMCGLKQLVAVCVVLGDIVRVRP